MAASIHLRKTWLEPLFRLSTCLHAVCLIVACVLLSSQSAFATLGETEDQCAQRYGSPTKVLSFDAASKTKEIFYGRLFEENIWVRFVDGVANRIQHLGGYSMRNPVIESCLADNAQGHQWTLSNSQGDENRTWSRDDGGFATLEPIKMENGDHWLSLTIVPPQPKLPVPTAAPRPTFMQAVVKPASWVLIPMAIFYVISEVFRFRTRRSFTDVSKNELR